MAEGGSVLGIDLGGTNVRAQALDANGKPAGPRVEGPSDAQRGTAAVLKAVAAVGRSAMTASAPVHRVGIAVPGHVDDARGLVRWAPNFGEERGGVFACWRDMDLRGPLERSFDRPVRLANDANAAALGEYLYGSGGGEASCLVLLTLGTGIGGGVVMRPSALLGEARGPLVLVGGNQGGAELGHILVQRGGVDCNAGTYGALEGYCQRDGIVRRAQHRLGRGRASIVRDMVEGDLSRVTPRILAEAADADDALAQEVWREVGGYLGAGIGSLINVFAPEVFAIGGQIAKAGEWVMAPARAEAENVAVPTLFADCRIVQAEVGDDAGMLGVAALAWEGA